MLEDFALVSGVGAFGACVARARPDRLSGVGDSEVGAELGVDPARLDRGSTGSLWNTAPVSPPPCCGYGPNASSTSSVRMWLAITQPTSRREWQSMTVAIYTLIPSASGSR